MKEWWRGGVIYQVYPRSFQDSNGDGVGDLPGIIERLDHIASLGVDCIWLSPITKSPQADMGYDVSDYKDVDPLFGSLQDFDLLIKSAHALGLKVIMDQVVSHSSDRHPWFQESSFNRTNPKADWYVWADPHPDGSPPNNWLSVFGGSAWEWHTGRKQYYLHNFLTSQPDLNFHNPEVQDAVLDTMRFWLERGLDGFRLDTVNYYFHDDQLRSNPPLPRDKDDTLKVNPYDMQSHQFSKSQPENIDWLKRVRKLLDEYPNATSVGEVGDDERGVELMSAYTAGSDMLHMCYSFDFLSPKFTAAHFRGKLETFFSSGEGWPCWSFSNHDVIRHMTRWAPHSVSPADLARQAAALVLTMRGSVCLYQGEELGLPETDIAFEELTDPRGIRFWPGDKGRDGCRTPMPWEAGPPPNGFTTGKPWLPIKHTQSALNVEGQNEDPGSTLSYYRELLAWRRSQPALQTGGIEFFDTPEPVLAYRRSAGNKDLICVFNLSPDARHITLSGVDGTPLEPVSNNATFIDEHLSLGPNGFAIVEVPAGESSVSV
ncbi:alpha-glucosidase family protein [Devosia sp. SD17-2]|jgi:alpha-glucosidase|uniref:alpha-glucosidase family protein n=1 Tax=Devosia sp. SD17-2 TaxID=2976459 RepID=UPI0023D7BD2E|nr:alpha-glucosidase family protein [Devosia sp. SD17-2]WEJ32624.1 alpha-glucosidase family protein [Devosia sp. SD17-2]